MSRSHRMLWLMVLSAGLAFSTRAAAVAPEIKDEGKFFGADAVKKADEQIRDIEAKYGKDLLIETYATVPADQVDKVKTLAKEERDTFFRQWARQRVKARVVNGIYVLVCKSPAHLYVEVTANTRQAFPAGDQKKLIQLLAEKFRAKQYDEGLLAAVQLVHDKLADASK